jgi:hypothetical protein
MNPPLRDDITLDEPMLREGVYVSGVYSWSAPSDS